MKYILYRVILLLGITPYAAFAQKRAIDTVAIAHWEHLQGTALSPHGGYVYYAISDSAGQVHGFIHAAGGSWTKKVKGSNYKFLRDDKNVLYLKGDSLLMSPVRGEQTKFIAKTTSYELLSPAKNEWLLYQSGHSESKETILLNLTTNKNTTLNHVLQYWFNYNSSALVVERANPDTVKATQLLYWLDLATGQEQKIWEGNLRGSPVFNSEGNQLAFFGDLEKSYGKSCSIWLYKKGEPAAKLLTNQASPGVAAGLFISGDSPLTFNKNGKFLFFNLAAKTPAVNTHSAIAAKVEIWRYTDMTLPLVPGHPAAASYTALVRTANGSVTQIENDDEKILNWVPDKQGKYLIVYRGLWGNDYTWVNKKKPEFFLISLETGSRTPIGSKSEIDRFVFSPDERFIIGFNFGKKTTYSYETATGIEREISLPAGANFPVAGWLRDGSHAFLFDGFSDLWEVDLRGTKPPVSLTKGVAKANHLNFRLLESEAGNDGSTLLDPTSKLHLAAFNKETKEEGFYLADLSGKSVPILLSMSNYHFAEPKKAAYGDNWLVDRQSASESNNLFGTEDFKSFIRITDVQPQKNYNWLTSNLIHWKVNDSTELMGILYKPEDFDPTKKYAVIFHYYEEHSDELNHFPEPAVAIDNINIPWFVSRGYLVFVPDISYNIVGYPGKCALNSVVSAANYLSQFAWVDTERMGLQGHSFGAYETNYIVTHCDKFKAAVESAGTADLISKYAGGIRDNLAGDNMGYYEAGQGRMTGTSLWRNRQQYIEESPIFNADKITTPMLMIHNPKDPNVSWSQGVELFTALWRLGKPAWMLQYANGEHFVQPGEDALDYTIRMAQFFDHYLKGAQQPKWMTETDPDRRLDTGYELNK